MGQTMKETGSSLRCIVLLAALAAVVAAMTIAMAAGPAATKNTNQGHKDMREPGPPARAGKGISDHFVAHCDSIDGSDSAVVFNPNKRFRGVETATPSRICLKQPSSVPPAAEQQGEKGRERNSLAL